MSHRHLLVLLGVLLIAFGIFEGGWFLLAIWMGLDFLIVGVAHWRGAHGIFGKRPDGTLPLWSWVVFFPLLIYTLTVWHLMRLFSREPARNVLNDKLAVGRRLLASEHEGEFDNLVDLTAEFPEPPGLRSLPCYRNFAILDGAAPTPEALRSAIESLRPGRTFIHCAQGHGRTGLFALAVLLKSGAARDVEDGLRLLSAARPGIRLSKAQRRCIDAFAQGLR